MYILDVEGRVVERLLYRVEAGAADAMRRRAPVRRDQFDNFIFEATSWVVGEASPDSFSGACFRYRAAHRGDLTSMTRPVPLVPPEIVDRVGDVVSRWRRADSASADHSSGSLSAAETKLRDELYIKLGGDRGDGPRAAGLRLYSRLWAARIGDGFVHPAVGGRIWGSTPAAQRFPDSVDPLITALYTVAGMADRWEEEQADHPRIDREIIDLAHSLGW